MAVGSDIGALKMRNFFSLIKLLLVFEKLFVRPLQI